MKLVVLLLVVLATTANTQDTRYDGEDETTSSRAESQILKLYQVLHDVALPSSDFSLEKPMERRLVLLLPGKILSYDDYFPGKPYVKSLKNQDPNARFVDIPPRIMENMFRLSDVIPGIDPFNGFESGESLSAQYREIVGSIDIKGFQALSEDKKKRFKESIDYLITKVKDPEPTLNCTSGSELPIRPECKEITRLSLYRRYQERYNKEKEILETEVEDRRQNLTSLQYQLWFTRTYPSLQARVDGALLDWLVFGDKDNVELFRSRLDTSSPGTVLLEAKSSLRSSEFTSLDRSQKIYPVTFVPGDWYKYIQNIPIQMSRDQVQQKIADLEAQRLMIAESISDTSTCSLSEIELSANETDTNVTTALIALVRESNSLKCDCVKAAHNDPNTPKANISECERYEASLIRVQRAAQDKGVSLSEVMKLQSTVNTGNNTAVQQVLDRIDSELNELRTQLPFAPGSTPDIAGFPGSTVDPNDKWLTFSYNSKQSQQQSQSNFVDATYSRSTSSYRRSSSYSWWWWYNYRGSSSSSYSSTYSRETRSNSFRRMTESEITVKGRLLRVAIQRPWFRPDLFKNDRFSIVNSDFEVSPGPRVEKDFIEEIKSNPNYKLPQYVTGFLLARDIEMEFRGVDKQTSQNIIRSSYDSYSSSSSSSYSGGWGPFSFASSSDYSSSYSSRRQNSASFQASATTSGLKIRVPGCQVIGYYTQVVPKFPIDN